VLASVVVGALAAAGLEAPAHAIIGDAPPVSSGDTQYAFVGFLRIQEQSKNGKKSKSHSCTTELIAPNVAITAAHCTDFKGFMNGAQIVFGATRRTSTVDNALPAGPIYTVRQVITAPNGGDLALLVLDRNVVGITPIKLPSAEIGNAFQRKAKATLVGWGTIDKQGTATAELRYANHTVTARNRDAGLHNPASSVTTNPDNGRQWGYYGDSGGALLAVSNGNTYLHGVFVRVWGRLKITDNYSINVGATGKWGYRDWVTEELADIEAADAVPLGDGVWSPTDAFANTARVNPAPDLDGNQGVWRFAQGTGLNASTYTLLTNFAATTCGIPGFEEFTVPGNLPAVGYNATGADMNSKGNCTSAIVTPRQTMVVHPWDNDVLLVWAAPRDGRVTISGRIWDADAACGEGISWQIGRPGDAGGTRLDGGEIDNGGSSSIDAASIGAVRVLRGEQLVLVIAKKADPNCDSTNVDFRITSAA
jgi:hypothetical protein